MTQLVLSRRSTTFDGYGATCNSGSTTPTSLLISDYIGPVASIDGCTRPSSQHDAVRNQAWETPCNDFSFKCTSPVVSSCDTRSQVYIYIYIYIYIYTTQLTGYLAVDWNIQSIIKSTGHVSLTSWLLFYSVMSLKSSQ